MTRADQALPQFADNRFYQSDVEDAERTLRWLRKEDMRLALQWIDQKKNIPTAWFAIEVLAPENGIKCIHKYAIFGKYDQRYHAEVLAGRGHGKYRRSHFGSSSWHDERIALCFAYRNAIRQLLPMKPNTKVKLAYRSNMQDEFEREYQEAGADPRDFIDFRHLPNTKGYRS